MSANPGNPVTSQATQAPPMWFLAVFSRKWLIRLVERIRAEKANGTLVLHFKNGALMDDEDFTLRITKQYRDSS